MKFVAFHLMPYRPLDLVEAAKHRSAWVVLPNSLYDPEKGADEYESHISSLVYAEELGFDGIAVNEHHQTAYGIMPAPNLIASALIQRTKRVKIAIIGRALPLVNNPLYIAEETAMLDNMSRGRIIQGFVRGIGAEYLSSGTNPFYSHDRFHEAHDLIIRAWSEPGPFEFAGKHYHINYVNVWPRPYQQPHPPVWIPSQGSRETIEFASHPSRKYTYLQTYSPFKVMQRYLQMYRDTAKGFGYTAAPKQLGWLVPIYIGDTDESAMAEAEKHYEAFRERFLHIPFDMLLPPGYTSRESYKGLLARRDSMEAKISAKECNDLGLFVCGTAKTVKEKLIGYVKEAGLGNILALLQFGTLPADLTKRNMERFAGSVMPDLRKAAKEFHGEAA